MPSGIVGIGDGTDISSSDDLVRYRQINLTVSVDGIRAIALLNARSRRRERFESTVRGDGPALFSGATGAVIAHPFAICLGAFET